MLSNQLNKRVLDNLSTAVFMLDDQFNVTFVNPAAEMLVHISRKRMVGQPFSQLFLSSEDPFVSELIQILNSGVSFTQREVAFVLHDGAELVVDSTITSHNSGKKDALLIEMQTRERIQRISMEEQILAKQETAKVLVRGLAHEIKNPLGGIRGAAQLLSLELSDPELQDYTQVIIEESDRLRDLVDRMLGSNKALRISTINLHELLERVLNLISAESAGSVTLTRDYDPSIPDIKGDSGQLIQAFLNIAKNALHALKNDNTDDPEIIVRTRILRQFTIGNRRHRLVAKIVFIDNGPGIPKELIQNIFYPMISGRPDGSGLGLSITQSIIGQHQGLVECESRSGNTKFIIYIPLEQSK